MQEQPEAPHSTRPVEPGAGRAVWTTGDQKQRRDGAKALRRKKTRPEVRGQSRVQPREWTRTTRGVRAMRPGDANLAGAGLVGARLGAGPQVVRHVALPTQAVGKPRDGRGRAREGVAVSRGGGHAAKRRSSWSFPVAA